MAFSLFRAQVARAVFWAAGLISLFLAASGLYGLVACTCELRLTGIGIRVALSARRPQVFRAIAGETTVLVLAGPIVGAGTAAAIVRLFAAFLYGASPLGPADVRDPCGRAAECDPGGNHGRRAKGIEPGSGG